MLSLFGIAPLLQFKGLFLLTRLGTPLAPFLRSDSGIGRVGTPSDSLGSSLRGNSVKADTVRSRITEASTVKNSTTIQSGTVHKSLLSECLINSLIPKEPIPFNSYSLKEPTPQAQSVESGSEQSFSSTLSLRHGPNGFIGQGLYLAS